MNGGSTKVSKSEISIAHLMLFSSKIMYLEIQERSTINYLQFSVIGDFFPIINQPGRHLPSVRNPVMAIRLPKKPK